MRGVLCWTFYSYLVCFFLSSGRRSRILVSVAWGLSAVFAGAPLFLWRIKDFTNIRGLEFLGTQCWNTLQSTSDEILMKLYMVITAVAAFIAPALIIMACYTIIVATIWRKGKMLTAPSHQTSGLSLRNIRSKGEELPVGKKWEKIIDAWNNAQ